MFVIAHRGANRFAPQNTIEAFRKAAELNSDGIETDIRITKDGHLVICHNEFIDKISDGKGKISDLCLNELQNFDFGSWFGSRFQGTPILTLDDFLDAVKDSDMSVLDIELKPVKGDDYSFVDEVIRKVKDYGLESKLLISSFDRKALAKVKTIDSRIKTGYLYPAMGDIVKRKIHDPAGKAAEEEIDYLLPHYGYVTKGLIEKAHRLGVKVAVWTVNKIEMVDWLSKIGVDGIITDFPDIIKNKIESL